MGEDFGEAQTPRLGETKDRHTICAALSDKRDIAALWGKTEAHRGVQAEVAVVQAKTIWPDQAHSSGTRGLKHGILPFLTFWPCFGESATQYQRCARTRFCAVLHCLNTYLWWKRDHCQIHGIRYILHAWVCPMSHDLCFLRINRK